MINIFWLDRANWSQNYKFWQYWVSNEFTQFVCWVLEFPHWLLLTINRRKQSHCMSSDGFYSSIDSSKSILIGISHAKNGIFCTLYYYLNTQDFWPFHLCLQCKWNAFIFLCYILLILFKSLYLAYLQRPFISK